MWSQRRQLVQAADPTSSSVVARCQALGLSRSSFYYHPKAKSALNLKIIRLHDEEFTLHNFKGVQGLRDHQRLAGYLVNEKRVRRLVRLMGHEPVYPKPRLSVPGQGFTPYPYLLRERPATAPNEVWSADITYSSMAHGFLYLTAVLDWYSRYVLSWELSNTLDVGFCLQALTAALRQAPAPYIFNLDLGSQFTCPAYEQTLLAAGCCISRDGRGRATDNAFIERRWRTVKWEHIYLNPADNGHQLHHQLHAYFAYYNHRRPDQSLAGQTIAQLYQNKYVLKCKNIT
ncbi:MAG: IS3 family transposase [Janthinobacterium lividum]